MSIIQHMKGLEVLPHGRLGLAALALAAVATLSAAAVCARSLMRPAQAAPEVRTTLGQLDFEPAEVTRGEGPFRLVVTNQSGKQGLTFRLLIVGDGTKLHESALAEGSAEWSQEFELPAGKYVLTEASNPAWLFYVTVQ